MYQCAQVSRTLIFQLVQAKLYLCGGREGEGDILCVYVRARAVGIHWRRICRLLSHARSLTAPGRSITAGGGREKENIPDVRRQASRQAGRQTGRQAGRQHPLPACEIFGFARAPAGGASISDDAARARSIDLLSHFGLSLSLFLPFPLARTLRKLMSAGTQLFEHLYLTRVLPKINHRRLLLLTQCKRTQHYDDRFQPKSTHRRLL